MFTARELENTLQHRANSSLPVQADARFAYHIVLSEPEYQQLVRLYRRGDLGYPEVYPWCHLKVLTETYLRVFQDTSDRKIRSLMSQELEKTGAKDQLPAQPVHWSRIHDLLKWTKLHDIGLSRTGKHLFKNVVAHAGVPYAYFEAFYTQAHSSYHLYANIERAIEFTPQELFESSYFSSFFKEAFETMRSRRLLFEWFLRLIDLSVHYELSRLNLQALIPGHLLSHKRFKSRAITSTIKRPGQPFSIDRSVSIFLNPYTLNVGLYFQNSHHLKYDKLPKVWQKELNTRRSISSSVPLPLWPEHLGKKFILDNQQTLKVPGHKSWECLLFDEAGNLIPSEQRVLKTENLFVLSKQSLSKLFKQEALKPLHHTNENWKGWFFYVLPPKVLRRLLKIELPHPYGRLKLNEESKPTSRWELQNFVGFIQNYPVFGGGNPPKLKIDSIDGNQLIIDYWSLNKPKDFFTDYQVQYQANAFVSRVSKQKKDVQQSSWLLEANQIFNNLVLSRTSACVWLPELFFSYSQSGLHFPHESLTFTVDVSSSSYELVVSPELELKYDPDNKTYTHNFATCPDNCLPLIQLRQGKHTWLELAIPLPYLSVSISKSQMQQKFWQEPGFCLEEVQNQASQGDLTLSLFYHGRTPIELYLIKSETERKQITLSPENFFLHQEIIICSELNQDWRLLTSDNRELFLFANSEIAEKSLEQVISISDQNLSWDFSRVYQHVRAEMYEQRHCFNSSEI